MNIINFIKALFKKETVINYGVIKDDTDNNAPYGNLYQQAEVVAKISTPTFKGVNGDGSIRKFPYQYQSSSSSCVMFTLAKLGTILFYLLKEITVKFSPGYWYTQRSNKPEEGSIYSDAVSLAGNDGCITNELFPSTGLSEEQMNALEIPDFIKESADAFKISSDWIELPIDFDNVASTIEATKKGVMLWFKFGSGEFFNTSYPTVLNNKNPWAHSVCAVDTVTENGLQYIVIEDSADQETYYQKRINRNFFKQKCIIARYPKNFKFAESEGIKPVFDGSVKSMQECLIYEGFLATGLNTGYNGELTKQALVKFQNKYGLSPATGNFGPLTKAKLLELYK